MSGVIDPDYPPAERCPDCGVPWGNSGACEGCGFDPAAVQEVAFVAREDNTSRAVFGWMAVVLAGVTIAVGAGAAFQSADGDNDKAGGLLLLASMLLLMTALLTWCALRLHRGRNFSVLRLRPHGWARRTRLGVVPVSKWKPWPKNTFIRFGTFDTGGQPARTVLLGSREAVPRTYTLGTEGMRGFNQPNRMRASMSAKASRDLFDRIAAARRLRDRVLNDGGGPTLEHVGRASHCPSCGYAFTGLSADDESDSRGGHCPECGWEWMPETVLFYGRNGPTFGSLGNGKTGPVTMAKTLIAILAITLVSGLGGLVPILLIAWAWKTLPPGYSHVALVLGVLLVVGGLTALIAKAARLGESKRERDDRLEDARGGPAGLAFLEVFPTHSRQGWITDANATPLPRDEIGLLRVTALPGGLRVRGERRGKPFRWFRRRPIDFMCDLAEPRREAKRLRSILRGEHLKHPRPPVGEQDRA